MFTMYACINESSCSLKKCNYYRKKGACLPDEMERKGRNMVNRCKGLPLAISALGDNKQRYFFFTWPMMMNITR